MIYKLTRRVMRYEGTAAYYTRGARTGNGSHRFRTSGQARNWADTVLDCAGPYQAGWVKVRDRLGRRKPYLLWWNARELPPAKD